MEFYRGSASPGIDEEMNAIIENISRSKSKGEKGSGSLRHLLSNSFFKPFSCIGILKISSCLSGYGTVMAYSNDYFDNAGAHVMSPGTDSVVLGVVKCGFTILAPFILLKSTKKTLFVMCGFISSLGFTLGNCFTYVIKSILSSFRSVLNTCFDTHHTLWQWQHATN